MDSTALRRVSALAVMAAVVLALVAAGQQLGASTKPVGAAAASAQPTPASTQRTAAATRPSRPRVQATQPARRPTASAPARARYRTTGDLVVVPGRSAVLGSGPVRRFKVEVERGLPIDAAAFVRQVERTLADPRGWGHKGRMSFQRVSSGSVAFTVVLASPATTDRLCRPLRTGGIFSCYNSRGRAVLNYRRWTEGARSYAGHLAEYRQYVISHEVGHALGHGHLSRCRSDGRAPTMMQQTKSLYGCTRNAWPYP